jgi:hypothetical protein
MSGIGIYRPTTYSTQKSMGRGIKMSTHSMKEKYMKRTLRQRIRDWLNDDRDDNIEIVRTDDVSFSRDNSLRFEIHQASGGRVVQTRRYDEKKDRHFENLYIITNDQDFGREIDKIITMEALR